MCSLDYEKDYELLFSVRLAAQCTDARVNLVTPALFARFPRLEDYAVATPRGSRRIHPLVRLLAGEGTRHRRLRAAAARALWRSRA